MQLLKDSKSGSLKNRIDLFLRAGIDVSTALHFAFGVSADFSIDGEEGVLDPEDKACTLRNA